MLVQFIFDNYLSFGSRQEFSMFSGKSRTYQQRVKQTSTKGILKFAALFGANASGKSNFIKAMSFMDQAVEEGCIPLGNGNKYCRTLESNRERVSYFEVILLEKDTFYSYGFEVLLSKGHFTSEWLIKLGSNGEELPIFTRDLTANKTVIGQQFSPQSKNRLQIYADDMQGDSSALFLTGMNTNKTALYKEYPEFSIFQQVYQWFSKKFAASEPKVPVTFGSTFLVEQKLKEVSALLQSFDTDIVEIVNDTLKLGEISPTLQKQIVLFEDLANKQFQEEPLTQKLTTLLRDKHNFVSISKDASSNDYEIKKIFFRHADGQEFSIDEESHGIIRLMDLAEILLTTESRVFVVDELDRCLHPQVTYEFVRIFLEHAAEHDIQLLVTSHESRLLDFDLLRRDEIWFVEKRKGESKLYSLEEFNERNDRKIDRAYLDGRYGGVPIFTTKVARERRIPFEVAIDPFYIDQNTERLIKSIAQMEATGNEAPDKK